MLCCNPNMTPKGRGAHCATRLNEAKQARSFAQQGVHRTVRERGLCKKAWGDQTSKQEETNGSQLKQPRLHIKIQSRNDINSKVAWLQKDCKEARPTKVRCPSRKAMMGLQHIPQMTIQSLCRHLCLVDSTLAPL